MARKYELMQFIHVYGRGEISTEGLLLGLAHWKYEPMGRVESVPPGHRDYQRGSWDDVEAAFDNGVIDQCHYGTLRIMMEEADNGTF